MASEKIKFISPIQILETFSSIPQGSNYGIELHNVPEMWTRTKGAGVKIAVIDTGLSNHLAVRNRIAAHNNFSNSDTVDDRDGHSTHVSGITCAFGNVGIAPEAALVFIKALGDDGYGDDDSIGASVEWATEKLDKNDIINMSLGGPSYYDMPRTHAAIKKAFVKGIHIICAAGNESSEVGVPARYEECIAVAAVDQNKNKAYFNNKGEQVDFAAAGVNVFSCGLRNTWVKLSGTSMACPQIAAMAALIISEHKNNPNKETPIESTEDLKEHIRRICVDLGPEGKDIDFGDGMPFFKPEEGPPVEPPVDPPAEQPKSNWTLFRWLSGIFQKIWPW